MYIDLDEDIAHWDLEAHKLFTFVGFTIMDYGYPILWTTPLAAAKDHPLITMFLDLVRDNYSKPNKPVALRGCYPYIKGSLLFDTGPYPFAAVYYHAWKENKLDSSVVLRLDSEDGNRTVKIKDGKSIQLKFKTYQHEGTGTWESDFEDNTLFGWLDANFEEF